MAEADSDVIPARRAALERRLAALATYDILNDEYADLDALVSLAAQVCEAPIAVLTLLDGERVWFKAAHGVDLASVELDGSFCVEAIESGEVLQVTDAAADPRFACNGLVVGPAGVRFYAGAPLITPEGVALGTMCVLDQRPRSLTQPQRAALQALARLAVGLLEARRHALMVAETESSFRAVFDHAAVGMLLASLDWKIVQANQSFAAMLGREPGELVGASLWDVTSEEDVPGELNLMTQLVAGQTSSVVSEKRCRHRDGGLVTTVSSTTVIRDAAGAATALLSHVESIEQRRRAEESLRETQSAVDAIITADADGLLTAWNDGAERVFGHTRSQALGQPVTIIIPEPFRAAHSAGLARVSAGGAPRLIGQTLELEALRRDGHQFPIELSFSMWDYEGRPRYTAVIRDITERRTLHDQLVRQANTDALTGVGNGTWLSGEVAAALQTPESAPLSLLVLGLEGLHEVDDSLGGLLRDRILVEVAERLTVLLRPDDKLARLDSGRFAVLLPSTTPAQARQVAFRLRDGIPAHFRVGSTPVAIRAAVGLASHRGVVRATHAPVATARLLRNATLALIAARTTSGQVAAYTSRMSSVARRRLDLHGALQGAIDRQELTLVYQPLVELTDSGLHGVEALARWTHPKLGAITPGEFIPLAEDTGLATRLGAWVLREACLQAVRWSHQFATPLPVSVNVSGYQLMDPAIAATISDVLASTGLDPALLTLEITESVLMSEPDAVSERLTAIKALGCRVAIDDFGTGYSSLASLTRFPIDELKIDKSFVAMLPLDERNQRVTCAIVELAHSLDLRTVAEGVETQQQRQLLTAMGCTMGQGYLFARPMPGHAIVRWQRPTLAVVRQETAAG